MGGRVTHAGRALPSTKWRQLALAALLALLLGRPAQAAPAAQWPNGAKAAVALTYDDALPSQLAHALPALNAAGFKATFFLSGVRQQDVAGWRAAAAQGHELGNHTAFHPCDAATTPTANPRYTAQAYTPDDMLREIAWQNVLLTALDGRPTHGFATPCGQTLAGGRDYLEALRASGLVRYARGVVTTDQDLKTSPAAMDPMHIPARGFPDGVDADTLIAFARQAVAGGGMAVFLFHGVGGDYLAVDTATHQRLIDWLAAHRDTVWVAPLGDVLDWAAHHTLPPPGGSPPSLPSSGTKR